MGIFDSLRSSFSTGKLKKEQIGSLRQSIWNAVSDGQITDQELQYINSLLILQKGEICHASLPAILVEERVVSRNWQGGSRGVNLRLVKGVSFRVGQQAGQMVSQSGIVPISEGYFVITNKRLVFSGDRKSVTTPIANLVDLHVFADGLNYSVTTRQKPVIIRLSVPEEAELCALIITRLINER